MDFLSGPSKELVHGGGDIQTNQTVDPDRHSRNKPTSIALGHLSDTLASVSIH